MKDARGRLAQFAHMLPEHVETISRDYDGRLAQVCAFLTGGYRKARRKHPVFLHSPTMAAASRALDGGGGSALLTELCRHLGSSVVINREFFKRLVLVAIDSLGWPITRLPCGTAAVSIRPLGRAPAHAGLLRRTVRRLRLPLGLIEGPLAEFMGEAWWGCHAAKGSCVDSNQCAFAVTASSLQVCRQLRRHLFSPRMVFFFSSGAVVLIESSRTRRNVLWLRTDAIWDFISLVRFLRRTDKHGTEVLHVGGLGDVLV